MFSRRWFLWGSAAALTAPAVPSAPLFPPEPVIETMAPTATPLMTEIVTTTLRARTRQAAYAVTSNAALLQRLKAHNG